MPALHERANTGPVCPNANGTVYSDSGYSWSILCNYDFPGYDLPAQPAKSLGECIDACNAYKQDENYLNGASCVAVVYGAGNPNGDPCYLKSQIQNVTSGNSMQYVARRTTYTIGGPPVYTSILPTASATSGAAAAASSSSTSSPDSSSSDSSSSSNGLSSGAKIGIGVAVPVVVVVIAALIFTFLCMRRRKQQRQLHGQPISTDPTFPTAVSELASSKSHPKPAVLSTTTTTKQRNHPAYHTTTTTLSEKNHQPTFQELPSPDTVAQELHSPTYHELSAQARGMSPTSELDDSATIHLTGMTNSRASVNPHHSVSTPSSWKFSGLGSSRGSIAGAGKGQPGSPGFAPPPPTTMVEEEDQEGEGRV